MRIIFSVSALLLVSSGCQAFQPTAPSFSTRAGSSSLRMAADYDFDVAIIGCGVGGHGAALHARAQKLKTAVFAGGDVGGTCVNRGCVPSKALLAASGRVREMKSQAHLESLGVHINPDDVSFSREGIAGHAKNLANRIKGNLEASLVGLGVDVIEGRGILTGKAHEVKDSVTGKIFTAKVRLYVGRVRLFGYTSLSKTECFLRSAPLLLW
jgi:dihydrolipoamide dehydrogenase